MNTSLSKSVRQHQAQEAEELDTLLAASGLDPATVRFPAPPVPTNAWSPQDWHTHILHHQTPKP